MQGWFYMQEVATDELKKRRVEMLNQSSLRYHDFDAMQ